jgi:ureidoglycolate lyase
MKVVAGELSDDAFAPFGRVLPMAPHDVAGSAHPLLVLDRGEGWSDRRTRKPLLAANASLGVTLASPVPCRTDRMERHLHTEEALFCMREPVVLVVAPPGSAPSPRAEDVRGFIIRPGIVVVLDAGTWHDACHGIGEPACYYWMATCDDTIESAWVEIEGGPVDVTVAT